MPAGTTRTTQAPGDHRRQKPREERRHGPVPCSTLDDPGRAPSGASPVRSCSTIPPARPQPAAACGCPAAPAGRGPCGPDPPGPQQLRDHRLRRPGPWLAASRSPSSTTVASASDTPPGRDSTRMMADDVLAVLDHAGVQRASLVGTSLGGMIAQELALAHPGGSTSWSWWPRSQADLRAAPCRYPPPTCSLGRRS